MKKSDSYRHFEIICYDTSDNNCTITNMIDIANRYSLDYCYICHSFDKKDDSDELKDIHYHFILNLQKTTLKNVSKVFNIPINYINIVDSYKDKLRYLIHRGWPDKYQYSPNEVIGTDKCLSDFRKSLITNNSIDESKVISDIFKYIDDHPIANFTALLPYVLENNYYSFFRRNYAIIEKYICLKNHHTTNYYY